MNRRVIDRIVRRAVARDWPGAARGEVRLTLPGVHLDAEGRKDLDAALWCVSKTYELVEGPTGLVIDIWFKRLGEGRNRLERTRGGGPRNRHRTKASDREWSLCLLLKRYLETVPGARLTVCPTHAAYTTRDHRAVRRTFAPLLDRAW